MYVRAGPTPCPSPWLNNSSCRPHEYCHHAVSRRQMVRRELAFGLLAGGTTRLTRSVVFGLKSDAYVVLCVNARACCTTRATSGSTPRKRQMMNAGQPRKALPWSANPCPLRSPTSSRSARHSCTASYGSLGRFPTRRSVTTAPYSPCFKKRTLSYM